MELSTASLPHVQHDMSSEARPIRQDNSMEAGAMLRSSKFSEARQKKLKNQQECAKKQSHFAIVKDAANQAFLTKQILEGALLLLEDNIIVQCRECDVSSVEACLEPAAEQYAKLVKTPQGDDQRCKFTIDRANFLPPPPTPGSDAAYCLGGVVLMRRLGNVIIDKTIDLMMKVMREQQNREIRI